MKPHLGRLGAAIQQSFLRTPSTTAPETDNTRSLQPYVMNAVYQSESATRLQRGRRTGTARPQQPDTSFTSAAR